jgi:hypothetical protein
MRNLIEGACGRDRSVTTDVKRDLQTRYNAGRRGAGVTRRVRGGAVAAHPRQRTPDTSNGHRYPHLAGFADPSPDDANCRADRQAAVVPRLWQRMIGIRPLKADTQLTPTPLSWGIGPSRSLWHT